MRNAQFISDYIVYDDERELDSQDAILLQKAHEAVTSSYAPYSHFHVGAAVRLANGVIITGCNIENAAYPSGLCAERVTLFSAQAQYPDVAVEAIAVTAHSDEKMLDEPVAPCGACRQVMAEVEQRYGCRLRILCQGETGPVMVMDGIESLMPFIFTSLAQ